MATELKVVAFDTRKMCSRVEVIETDDTEFPLRQGQQLYVDLTVNADFGEMPESDLVGKTVIVERFQAHELFGIGVKIKDAS